MKLRGFATLTILFSVLAGCLSIPGQTSGDSSAVLSTLKPALESIQGETILAHIKLLGSDDYEGRGQGTRGETVTVDYRVNQFKRAGLMPGNPDGTFVQKVPLVGFQTVPQIEISAGGQTQSIKFLDDFVHDLPALSPSASVKNAGVVFAGYGIEAVEYSWDDYKGVDVRNKLVIVLSGEPSQPDTKDPNKFDPTFFKGDTRTYHSTREAKYDLAAKKGAAGILIVSDPEKAKTYSIFQTFSKMEGFGLKLKGQNNALVISGLITIGAARRLFSLAWQDIDKLQASASQRNSKAIELNAKATISVKSKIRNVVSQNVVARVEGSDPKLQNEFVIYSAHWDHLGKDPNLKGDQIYNGALDNAAGTGQFWT